MPHSGIACVTGRKIDKLVLIKKKVYNSLIHKTGKQKKKRNDTVSYTCFDKKKKR